MEDLRKCLVFAFLFYKLGDQVGEVDRFSDLFFDSLNLFLVKYVAQIRYFGRRIVARELNRWESKFSLLHVVVDLLVKVLAHVCLKDDRKVITEPLTIAACV